MIKKSLFPNTILPYLLVLPQIFITLIFFVWPALQAIYESFHLSDPFGVSSQFVYFDNFLMLLDNQEYFHSFLRTLFFSFLVCLLSMSSGLLFAVLVNRLLFFKKFTQTLLIWPYAIAPAMAGVLWLFIFHPSYGVLGHFLAHSTALQWNPVLNGTHAMGMVILAASWKQVSYNFVFFLSALQSIPQSIIEAASIDGAGPFKRFWKIIIPLLSPTTFFLIVMNLVYAFFETFGVIHTTTEGGPGAATSIMVYKVFADGFVGQDLGGSSAQSVILMLITIFLIFIQFKYVESKVQYGAK